MIQPVFKKYSKLSDELLHSHTLAAAANEKLATLTLLDYLAEVDARRLYAVMGYSSLWLYVHKELHYSETQTAERINAMRLMSKIPEVKKELEAGNLSLTTASKLAHHVRREKCATEETLALLNSVTKKSSREVDRVLCANATTAARPDQVRPITPQTTRITIEVDQEFLELMTRVQELAGHAGSPPQELFKISMKEFVKRREIKNTPSPRAKVVTVTPVVTPTTEQNQTETPSRPSRYISIHTKNKIRARSGDQCEYRDPHTKRRCESRMRLEFDHIIPHAYAHGARDYTHDHSGDQSDHQNSEQINEENNLRHYCSAHNKLHAIQTYGQKKMRQYLKM